jgi:hypothetical protein
MKDKELNQIIERQKEEIIKSLDKKFIEKATKIFHDAKNGNVTNVIEKLSYSRVSNSEALKIKQEIGLDLEGYEHNITNMDIKHILKNHGNEKIENFRGQVAITEKDILLIPEITKKYDAVILSDESNANRKVLLYRKRLGNEYYYLETVSNSIKKELRSKTMWIVRKK